MRARNHTKTTKFLGCVEDGRRETRRHFRVQSNLDSCLNLGLAFDNSVKQVDCRNSSFAVVGEESDQRGVPFVGDLGECGGTRRHKNLSNTVVELLNILLSNLQESVGCTLFCGVVNKRPNTVLDGELLILITNLGENADLETAHGKQQVRVVATVNTNKAVIPIDRCHRSRKTVFQVPEYSSSKVDIVAHQAHTRISRPALLTLVSDHVLEVGVRLLCKEPLDEISGFLSSESKHNPDLIDVTGVESNRMTRLGLTIAELQEVVGALRRASNLAGSLRSKQEKIQHKTIKLKHKCRELQTTDHTITVDMVHVLVGELNVVLGRDVVCQVVVHNQSQERVEKRKLHLLVHLGKLCLNHDVALAVLGLPDTIKVVDTLSPLVDQKRWDFRI
ncbi:hypothetical protein HG531_007372 [Fusarium graminearum]|nr:hypothetical protein HG531_007372 [Fusarium graminearum]